MDSLFFVLDADGDVVRAPDVLTWARWFEQHDRDRRIAATDLGDVQVSTVFLGIDHGFGRRDPPLIFETMVFGGPFDDLTERYATREEALVGHGRVVEKVRGGPW